MTRNTHEREYDDHEYVGMAISKGKEYRFGTLDAYYKLYYTGNAAVFFFDNNEEDRVLHAEFKLEKRNLALVDEDESVNEFYIELLPGNSTHKILMAVDKK